jgi:hypothetical protein
MSAASGSANWTKRTDDSWNAPSVNQSGAWNGSWYSWDSNYKKRDEGSADYMASGTPKQDPDENFERAEPHRRWIHPKHTDVLDLKQRPMTPERSWAAPEEPSYVGLPPSGSRCVSPHGASQRERVAGEKVWYERDWKGTVMITEEPNGKESRKRVSASPTAAVTPSRQSDEPPYHGYFLREGHLWDDGKRKKGRRRTITDNDCGPRKNSRRRTRVGRPGSRSVQYA